MCMPLPQPCDDVQISSGALSCPKVYDLEPCGNDMLRYRFKVRDFPRDVKTGADLNADLDRLSQLKEARGHHGNNHLPPGW